MALHHVPPQAIAQTSNDEAWIGFAVGNIPGAVIGYVIGRSRLDREAREGKSLSDEMETFNRGGFSGASKGALVGTAATIGLGLIGLITLPFSSGAGFTGLGLAAIAPLAGTVVGFVQGSQKYNRLKSQELDAAAQIEPHEIGRGRAKSRSRAPEPDLDAPDMERSHAASHDASKSFAESERQRMNEREQSQAQGTSALR